MGPVIVIVAVLLVAAFPSSAQGQEEWVPWPHPYVVIGEAPPHDHEGEYESFDCPEQFALVVTDLPGCGDFGGEHVRTGYIKMGWRTINAGNYGPVPLTGMLEAKVTWDQQDHDLHCRWHMGEFQGCLISTLPPWPDLGDTFEFTCKSQDNAIGGWSECFLEHGGTLS